MFEFNNDLKKLNEHLADKAYINGFKVSKEDAAIFLQVFKMEIPDELTHVKRWAKHMSTYTVAEFKNFEGECCCCCGAKCAAKEEKKEEEIDLFGEEEEELDPEEQKRIEETRKKIEAAKAAGKKPKKVDRSMLVLNITPYEDTTDMNMVLEEIPKRVQMEGLTWGKGEVQKGPFGVNIVAIACIIVDDLCSADDLCDQIIDAFDNGDLLQNAKIMSFNKCE